MPAAALAAKIEAYPCFMESLLTIRNLRVEFPDGEHRKVRALNGVNLRIIPGEALGLLGESGCGKSTLAKSVLRLLPAGAKTTGGRIEWEGRDLLALSEQEMQQIRGARISLIPQDPGLALNPFMKIGKQVAEVLRAHRQWKWSRCCEEAESLLQVVRLENSGRRMFDAYPHQLSGGQQQRVVIAQAISCQPGLLIADEPTASLDAATEEEILRLLGEMKARHKLALLFITHDPKILTDLADRIAVMYAGRIIEKRTAENVLEAPLHPYAKALLACVPPERGEGRLARGQRLPTIPGNSPAPAVIPRGCSFAPRCSSRLEVCEQEVPQPKETAEKGFVECFLYDQ